MSDEQNRCCVNTDREIWRERPGDYYADSIHVTKDGGIGINCGGFVYVKPVREWHKLAGGTFPAAAPSPSNPRDDDLVREIDNILLQTKTGGTYWTLANVNVILQRLRDRIVEQAAHISRCQKEWTSYDRLVVAQNRAFGEELRSLRDQLVERTRRLHEIAQRLESAAAETDCFNVCEARDLARQTAHPPNAEDQPSKGGDCHRPDDTITVDDSKTGAAHPPNAEGTSEGEVQNMTGRLRESAEDHRILEKWAKHEMLKAASMIDRLAARLAETQAKHTANHDAWLDEVVRLKRELSEAQKDSALLRKLREVWPAHMEDFEQHIAANDAAMKEGK